MKNRITELLGVKYPIVQAPMGWIARAQLASAVSNAGGLGIIQTSSGRLDEVREEVKKMKGLTDKPWGINVAQAFVRDPKTKEPAPELAAKADRKIHILDGRAIDPLDRVRKASA